MNGTILKGKDHCQWCLSHDRGVSHIRSILIRSRSIQVRLAIYHALHADRVLLRPVDNIYHQNNIGFGIMMALDDVVSSVAVDPARFRITTHRTVSYPHPTTCVWSFYRVILCLPCAAANLLSSSAHSQTLHKNDEHLQLRWLDRCFDAHRRPNDQNLFPCRVGWI